MIVNTLNKMEEIVSANPSLSWEGWNVIHLAKSNNAMYKTNGAFINNQWQIKTVYSPDRNGWDIKKEHIGA